MPKSGNRRNGGSGIPTECRWTWLELKKKFSGRRDGRSPPDDVVFNREYAAIGTDDHHDRQPIQHVTVEKLDPLTVRVRFKKARSRSGPTLLVGGRTDDHPQTSVRPYKGANSRADAVVEARWNRPYLRRVQTGRHRQRRAQYSYHVGPDRPYFDATRCKGGGDDAIGLRAPLIQRRRNGLASKMQVETRSCKTRKTRPAPEAASRSCRAGRTEAIEIIQI